MLTIDRQQSQGEANTRVPVISPVLHVIAMPALVYLRCRFGYSFLRPRSVFFILGYSMVLFTIYAFWNDARWSQYAPLCFFGMVAFVLYGLHWVIAFTQQIRGTAEHDQFSGKSNLVILLQAVGVHVDPDREWTFHWWVEPAFVALLGGLLQFSGAGQVLVWWLYLAAAALWCKEALNYWLPLRRLKRHQDSFQDAEESLGKAPPSTVHQAQPKAVRKSRRVRKRVSNEGANDPATERMYAEKLRLLPPFTLEQAEQNYRMLMKESHPDADGQEGAEQAQELNLAIEYFRSTLSET